MNLKTATKKANKEEEEQAKVTMQILKREIPCTYKTCYNWRAGLCGNPNISVARRTPPKFCEWDIRLRNYKYPVEKRKNIKNPRYKYD